MKKFLTIFLLVVFLIPTYALADFIDIDITTLTDEELTSLLEEATNLAASIRNEQNVRDYERAVASLGDSSIDPLLVTYEGVYQRYSTFGEPHFEDDDFIVIKDGILYEYGFTFERTGKASLYEWTLVSYETPNLGTIYCDKEQITEYATGEHWYVSYGGIKLSTMKDGNKCLQECDVSKKRWSITYDTYYFLPVTDVTKAELDGRYFASVGRPSPSIGMTAEEVLNSNWGSPARKNRTVTSHGIEEQWVYDNIFVNGYIYLTNGIVTSIQY